MVYHNRKILLYFTIGSIIGMGFYLPSVIVSVNASYPENGIVGMWVGDDIPYGWTYLSAAENRFMYGDSGDYYGWGGLDSHSHVYNQTVSHSHGYTDSRSSDHNHRFDGGGSFVRKGVDGSDILTYDELGYGDIPYSDMDHEHIVSPTGEESCQTEVENTLPPFQTVKFIKKILNGVNYPKGLILLSTSGTTPSGWIICNGENGTPDLRGDFVRGSSTPNSTGGSETHQHSYTEVPLHNHTSSCSNTYHNHLAEIPLRIKADTIFTPEYNAVTVTMGETEPSNFYHTHGVTNAGSSIGYTSFASHIPEYVAVDFIMCTQETPVLPEEIIAIWVDSLSTIPFGWDQCDGTSGTIDLREKFLRGRESEIIGSIGGSNNHSHTYSTIPSHTHSLELTTATHTHANYEHSGYDLAGAPLLGLEGFPVYNGLGVRNVLSNEVEHDHYILTAGDGYTLSTHDTDILPEHLRVHFIQCNYYEGDAPVYTNTPNNRILEYGYTGQSLAWTATDDNPDNYSLFVSTTGIYEENPWSSGVPITFDIPDGFEVGSYSVSLRVYDKFINENYDYVNIQVVDTTKPLITSTPSSQTVEYGYTGQAILWTATDSHPDYYEVERLGAGIVAGPIEWTSGTPIIYNIPDGLDAGTYEYNITFMDDYGNSEWHVATFHVEDTTGPIFTSIPDDMVLEHGYSSLNITWIGTDPYPHTYTIDRHDIGVIVGPLSWTSGVEINYSIPIGLEVGTYTYTINVTDMFGNYQPDSMNITVEDTTAPIIGTPASDLVVNLDYTGLSFSWGVTDPHAENYTIELMGSGILEGPAPWISGSDITYSIPDGLSEGIYSYVLNVTDQYGNHANHLVTLTVESDHEDPVIVSSPDDITVDLDYTDQILTWTATDLNPSHYIIELQDTGIVVDSTVWISGESVMYTMNSGKIAGTYEYIITFYDEYGNSASDSVAFTVENNNPDPTIPGFNVPFVLAIAGCTIAITVRVIRKKQKA